MSQSLELNQRHHVMHLLPEVDCGPKAWTVLKELHAPTSVVATLMLERELSALRLSEGEPVQPVLDKMRDLYAKLATAGITYPEQTKCLKMLSLLPESWLQFTSGLSLPQDQTLWTLEWVRTKILEEDFRRRQLRGGDNGSSGYGMQGSRYGRGRGFGGAGRGAKKDDDSNDQQGGTGWGRGAKSGRGGKSSAGDASAKVGAELHPLDYWVLDTGAAWTMTPHKELLDDVRAAPINEVCSASGHALKVAGAGRAAFKGADCKPVVLHDFLLFPDLKANLISLRKLAKAGVSTSTDGARTYKGQLGNRVLWDLHESKDVYRSMWQLPVLAWHGGGQAGEGSASQGEYNAVGGVGVKVSARSGETDWATAHRRLGHVAMPLLKQLEKDGAVKGLKLNGQPPDDNCEICLLSKVTRFPFHSVNGKRKKPLELVRIDLVGPLPVQGHKGEWYFLTIVDDWSRLMWAYPLKQNDHAASTIKEDLLPFVEKQAESVVKRIRTDRGGEFLGAETTAWLKKQGIQRELPTAYSPQSNGVAERANRTILETARALLIESGVGNSMWPHAVRHATVARNGVLTKVGNESWVPLGRKPLVDMLSVFGCMAVAHVPKKYRSNRDVKFVEGMMYGGWKKQSETNVSEQMEHITMQLDLTPSVWEEGEEAAAEDSDGEVQEAPAGGGDDVETSGSTKEAAGSEGGEQQLGKAKIPSLPSRRKPKGVVMRGWETPVSRPGRTRMATMKLTAGADVAEQQLGNEEALLILPHGYHPDEEDEPAYCFLAPAPKEPASMEEALAGPDREKWLVSRDAEYQSLLENGTWDLVVLPEGKKAVQCKWVLRIKTDDKGQVTIYKSRLVAKGFMQKDKQDFNEIFAPTAKPPTLRVLLADAAISGKFIIQMDISTAFLKLKKSIYGLKQAPRCWYQKLAAVLEEMGFRTSSSDESLFLKGDGEKLVLFLVYVDDILLFSSSMKEIQKVQQQQMKNFKCKTLGEVKYYLGMHVERDLDHRWLKLHQEKLDSGASRSFFRDSTTVTPLRRPVAVSLADPSGGPVLAHSSTVLPCPAAPSGLLSGLHLPSFSTNLVSGADLQDVWIDQFTPGGQRVTHCTCSRTGHHLALFTRRPGSSLYTLTTAPPPVPASGQVAASSQVFAAASRSSPASAPYSCRSLAHETLLWHHRLGHPSLPSLRGMASRALVSGLQRSLPPLPPGPAPTCVPCVKGRQRAAPHSCSFPPTEAPLQTLHMDVWGPARVRGQGHERYFLLVVDDYSRYTTVFPLRSKGEVPEVLIEWICGARRQLSESFGSDLPVLRLHSDRGEEFSSDLLRAFCCSEGIRQTFTLPASPQQNGIAEHRIGMVMDVARTSMIHAAAPHFLWPFAVQYAAHQINLQPRVSLRETTPTLCGQAVLPWRSLCLPWLPS
ncbi:unnamed protein product [Closterium sp. NIES-54]